MIDFDRIPVSRRKFVGGSAAAAGALALAGCSSSDSDSGSSSGSASTSSDSSSTTLSDNTMIIYLAEPSYIDPYCVGETSGAEVMNTVFDTLYKWDWDAGAIAPLAAADLPEVSDDGLTYTITLREGMTFHNGDAVDAASFKRGWERTVDPTMAVPSSTAYHFAPIVGYDEFAAGEADEMSGVVAVDDLTLQVTLQYAWADFTAVMCHQSFSPVPEVALEDPEGFLEQPIGNGPFYMTEAWQHNQYINCARFEDYYGDAPSIDGVYFAIYDSKDTAYNEFQAGTIDFSPISVGMISDAVEAYGESEDGYTVTPGNQVLLGSKCATDWIACNNDVAPLDDPDVRHAISLAINRDNICETLYENSRVPANSIVPPVLDTEGTCEWEYCTYDPDKAAELLDTNYPVGDDGTRGINITISFASTKEDIMASIQSDLEAVGITVTQDVLETSVLYSNMNDGNYEMGYSGWTCDYPILDNFMYPCFYSTSGDNSSQYNNPDVDAALEEARQIQDDDERRAAYGEICQTLSDAQPVIPIMFDAYDFVGSDRITNFYSDPQVMPDFITAELDV